MNIQQFEFPKPSLTLHAHPDLLREAKNRGVYNGDTPYNQLFLDLFHVGGRLNFKDNLDPDFKDKAVQYLKSVYG